jgi:hypothetical protein
MSAALSGDVPQPDESEGRLRPAGGQTRWAPSRRPEDEIQLEAQDNLNLDDARTCRGQRSNADRSRERLQVLHTLTMGRRVSTLLPPDLQQSRQQAHHWQIRPFVIIVE